MTTGQRRAHLAIWAILGPLLVAIIVIGLKTRPAVPITPSDRALGAAVTGAPGVSP